MKQLIRSEIRKLTTTTWFQVTMAVTIVVSPISVVANVYSGAGTNPDTLGSVDSIHHILSLSAFTSMVMLAVGIAAMAGEYRHGTSVPTFLVTPRRARVVGAKLLTIADIGAVVGAAAFGIGVAVAIPSLSTHGIHHLAGDTAQMWLGAILTAAAYGALGVAFGAITRSTVAAIIGALVWVLFIEQSLLAQFVPAVGKWLPTGANLAITHVTKHPGSLLSPAIAVVVLAAWTAMFAVAATRLVSIRDV